MILQLLFSIGKLSLLSLGGRLLGLYKESVFAKLLGSTGQADIFIFVDRIPKFLYAFFVEGLIRQAILPVLMGYHGEKRKKSRRELETAILGVTLLTSGCMTLFLVWFCPLCTALFGFGWFLEFYRQTDTSGKFLQSVSLLRITLPFFFCSTLIGTLGAFLSVRKSYLSTTSVPLLVNIGLIISASFFAPNSANPLQTLASGLLLTGVTVLIGQLIFAYYHDVSLWPIKFNLNLPGLKRILQLFPPILLNAFIAQTRLLCLILIGSFLPSGAPSCLHYTYQLADLPTGALTAGIGTVFLPWLSKQYQKFKRTEDPEIALHFQHLIQTSLRMNILLALPILSYMLQLPNELLNLFFGTIYHNSSHQNLFFSSLQIYHIGNFIQTISSVLLMALYAQQKVKATARITLATAGLEMLFSVLAIPFGALWSAIGYTVAVSCRVILLFYALKTRYLPIDAQVRLASFSVRCFLASLLTTFGSQLIRFYCFAFASAPLQLLSSGLFLCAFYPLALKIVGITRQDCMPHWPVKRLVKSPA